MAADGASSVVLLGFIVDLRRHELRTSGGFPCPCDRKLSQLGAIAERVSGVALATRRSVPLQ
jgi:hypothetical protein